jgi:hypothetical protein
VHGDLRIVLTNVILGAHPSVHAGGNVATLGRTQGALPSLSSRDAPGLPCATVQLETLPNPMKKILETLPNREPLSTDAEFNVNTLFVIR